MTTNTEELKVIRIPISKPDGKGGHKQVTTTEEGNNWNGYLIPTHMIELDPTNSPHDAVCSTPSGRCHVRNDRHSGNDDAWQWHIDRYKERWENEREDFIEKEQSLHWIIVNKVAVAPDKYTVIDNERIYLLMKAAGIPYLQCIVHEYLDDYQVAEIQVDMNATHAVMPFRTWSERDEVRFLLRWFKEFVTRKIKHTEDSMPIIPQTLEQFLALDFEKRLQWINQFSDRFAFINPQRLYNLLYLGYKGHCLDCTIKDLELEYIRDKKRLPPTRSESDRDELLDYAIQKMGAKG